MNRLLQHLPLLLLSLTVTACGGGGDEDAPPRLTLSGNSVSVTAAVGDAQPTASLTASISRDVDIYVGYENDSGGLSSVEILGISPTLADVVLSFEFPEWLGVGTYTGSVTIHACLDENCTRPLAGSPATITTTYTVTPGAPYKASVNVGEHFASAAAAHGEAAPSRSIPVTINNPEAAALYSQITTTTNGMASANFALPVSASGSTQIDLAFREPATLAGGRYSDTVQLSVCYDAACTRHVDNSPRSIQAAYSVSAPAAPDRPIVPTRTRHSLPHDVIDAEYSAALDAVVMVASYPSPALYVFDPDTGHETSMPLDKVPTAVAIGPDGRQVAVGHDAQITYADLGTPSSVAPTPIRLLAVSRPVFDLVLTNTHAHVFPADSDSVPIHSVNLNTNVETRSRGQFVTGNTRARLHPSESWIYGATDGLSPDEIEKYDIAAGHARYIDDSPYHGHYKMCGNLWIAQTGLYIYTACGHVFRSSAVREQDMGYHGSLQLSAGTYGYHIDSLSESEQRKEIMLVENDPVCLRGFSGPPSDHCRSYLNLYESEFFNLVASYSIAPLTVVGRPYAQLGLFAFHSNDGNDRYLLSRLISMPNPATEYYLTVLD